MINLKDCTFIIPVRIESEDRAMNAKIVLNYLCKHLDTNIIILEHDIEPKIPEILNEVSGNRNINYRFVKNDKNTPIFHRTKFLNIMLNMVKTPVVVNYDVDIILKPETYEKCRNLVLGGVHFVYPYFWGDSQFQVYYSGRNKIHDTISLNTLEAYDYNICRSEYGHCQFFNTEAYKYGGMENEGFISYAPEDQERGYRFKKLGYSVMWSDDYVYHLEHSRGINSSGSNPMMKQNNALFEKIKKLSEEELREYYKNIDYIKNYH